MGLGFLAGGTAGGGLTLTSTVQGVCIPQLVRGAQTSIALTFDTINTTTGKMALIFRIPKSGNIHKIHINFSTVTTPSNTTLSLQTVDQTTGAPTGTNYNGSSNTTITPTLGFTAYTLSVDAAVVANDEVAIVLAATTTISVQVAQLNANTISGNYPYQSKFAGSWSKRTDRPVFLIEYDDGTLGECLDVWPLSSVTAASFNSGSTPDERGMNFTLPWPVRVAGAWVYTTGAGDFDIKLYAADLSTVAATISTDKDVKGSTGEGTYMRRFASPVTLVANTPYKMTIVPTSVTNVLLYEYVFPSAAALATVEFGSAITHTTRTDAGAWTDSAVTRPVMGLIIDQLGA